MKVVYDDEVVTYYHGDAFELLEGFRDHSVGLVLTDPPYRRRTTAGARSRGGMKGKRGGARFIDFEGLSDDEIRRAFDEIGRVAERWVVSFMDYHHAVELEKTPPVDLRFVRMGSWGKPNGAPQYTGDRPAQGWEAIAIMHLENRRGFIRGDWKPHRMVWNGRGSRAAWWVPKINGVTPTEKPPKLLEDLIRKFSNPGDVIVDPFAGSGSTLAVARALGRRAIGCDNDPDVCEKALAKLASSATRVA